MNINVKTGLLIKAVGLVLVTLLAVYFVTVFFKPVGLHDFTLKDDANLDTSSHVNAENSGKGNTQIKGVTSGGDATIITGSNSGNVSGSKDEY